MPTNRSKGHGYAAGSFGRWHSGGYRINCIHRHADGRAILAATQWHLREDGDDNTLRVTEVHSDPPARPRRTMAPAADIIELLAHDLSEPLAAIRHCVDGVRRILDPGWPDVGNLHEAMASTSQHIDRSVESARLVCELATAIRNCQPRNILTRGAKTNYKRTARVIGINI